MIQHAGLRAVVGIAKEIERITRIRGRVLVGVPTPGAVRRDARELIEIEPRPYVPGDGTENGLPHHVFSAGELRSLFPRFQVLELQEIGGRVHCIDCRNKFINPR